MNTDSYFEIGSTHIICEDYTLTGTADGDLAYAILCDGCSSSNHTDLGARLLAHIAKDALLYLNRRKLLHIANQDLSIFLMDIQDLFKELILKKVSEVKSSLCLNSDVFDATLLVSIAIGPIHRCLMSWGDGYIIVKRKPRPGGTTYGLEIINTEYTSGAPYYLSYALSHDRKEAYKTSYGTHIVNRHHIYLLNDSSGIHIKAEENESRTFDKSSFCEVIIDETEDTMENPENLYEQPISQIILSSDGLGTYKKGLEELSVHSLLPDMLNYKNPKGEFVQRKMKNAIGRDHKEQGITHYDDISFAVINI
jgi:hypothetical protein